MSWIKDILTELGNIDTSAKKVRNFGVLVGSIFTLLGFFNIWFFGPWALIVGLVLLILGLIYPTGLWYLYYLWMGIAVVLGYTVSRIILLVIFFLILTPISLIARIFRSDVMQREWEPEKKSYWTKVDVQSSIEELH